MDTRDLYKLVRELSEEKDDVVNLYDSMDIELSEDFVIETGVVGFMEDGVIIHLDEDAMEMLDLNGILLESEDLEEGGYGRGGYTEVDDFKRKLSSSNDPFEMIYGAISGDFGEEIRNEFQEMYDDVVIDSRGRLHPDDDFEQIINTIVDQYVDDGEVYESDEDLEESNLSEDAVDLFKAKLSRSNDPYEMIYDAIKGDYGDEIRGEFQEMYDDVVIDSRGKLHPDDDFEEIISTIVDQYVDDGETGHYDSDQIGETDQLDELSLIKRLLGGNDKPTVVRVREKTPAELWKQHTEPKKSTDKVPVDPITGKTLYQKVKDISEAEYQGRKVTLNKPMAGDVKKSKVYVKNEKGNVVKVNFGDKDMKIKKSNPERRKSFRARHNCDNPGPKWKARYWSCRAW
jgi:hypothetical protein